MEDTPIPTRCIFEYNNDDNSKTGKDGDGDGGGDGEKEDEIQHAKRGISQIATGGNHTLVLFGNGEVYIAGVGGGGGSAGTGNDGDGGGDGSSSSPLLRFEKVNLGYPVRRVSATWEGSFFVVSGSSSSSDLESGSDAIYVSGTGWKGELGLGGSNKESGPAQTATATTTTTPIRIPEFPPPPPPPTSTHKHSNARITTIASGMGHTVAILDTGEVYGWGASRKGQLGPGLKDSKIIWSPTRVDGIPFRATGAACGREFTVISGDKGRGEIVILGSDGDGGGSAGGRKIDKWGIFSDVLLPSSSSSSTTGSSESGTGTGRSAVSPRPTKAVCIPGGYDYILTSWNGVYVHFCDCRVLAWGRGDRGQLPVGRVQDKQKDDHQEGGNATDVRFKKIAVGSEHGLGLLEDEKTVVAFGWGEHGNCGVEVDEMGDVKGRLNVIPLDIEDGRKVTGISGGCATSWIVTS